MTDADLELISAAVDGELPPADLAAFRRLIAGSPAAARWHAALVRDRDRLRAVRPVAAPAGLAAGVAARLAPATPHRAVVSTRRRPWVPMAVAASFFLAVGTATFLVVGGRTGSETAEQKRPTPPANHEPHATPDPTPPAVPPETDPPPGPSPMTHSTVVAEATPAPVPETAPVPRPADVLASPPAATAEPLEAVEVRLPVLLPVADLGQDDARAAVRAELAGGPAYRIDLFARDTHRAAELLVAAGRAVRLTVGVEQVAAERLRRKMPSAWAAYTDALTPDEVAAWLAAVAAADADAESARTFTAAHLIPAQAAEQKDLRDLFGAEPVPGKRSRPTGPRSVAAGTLGEVTDSLQKGATKPAVLVTYLPAAARVNPLASKDVKAYHDRAGERKPGTVAVLVVVRPAS